MDYPESYHPSTILADLGEQLYHHDSNLRVQLPSNIVSCDEALSATLRCVAGLPVQMSLPTTNPVVRAAIRRMALENIRSGVDPITWNMHFRAMIPTIQELVDPPRKYGISSSLAIRSMGRLRSTDLPEPITPERRALLKQRIEYQPAYPSHAQPLRSTTPTKRSTLASIIGNARLTAVDWEKPMPVCILKETAMIWNTGASSTMITTDVLDKEFQSHLSDKVHYPYQDDRRTRVQISLTIEFTNGLFTIDILAWAIPKDMVPDLPSGIILGQSGCIDRIQYRSIPRSILEAKGEVVDPDLWGDFILEEFVDLDGSVKEIH